LGRVGESERRGGRVQGSGFRDEIRVQGAGFRDEIRVQGAGFRVQGARVQWEMKASAESSQVVYEFLPKKLDFRSAITKPW